MDCDGPWSGKVRAQHLGAKVSAAATRMPLLLGASRQGIASNVSTPLASSGSNVQFWKLSPVYVAGL